MHRRTGSIVALAAAALTVVALATPAGASSEESQFVSLTNSARSSHGLHAYGTASDLVAVARRHSQEMAAKHTIYHNPNLANDVQNWQAVGENVGMGPSPASIHDAFMKSTAHRANILDADFTQVGIGTAYDDKGVLYVTEVFRQPMGASARPPAPAPAPRPAPKPAPRPVTHSVSRSRPVTQSVAPAKPAAKPVVKAPTLATRLAAAKAAAAKANPTGAIDHAVAFVSVMASLG